MGALSQKDESWAVTAKFCAERRKEELDQFRTFDHFITGEKAALGLFFGALWCHRFSVGRLEKMPKMHHRRCHSLAVLLPVDLVVEKARPQRPRRRAKANKPQKLSSLTFWRQWLILFQIKIYSSVEAMEKDVRKDCYLM